MRWKVTLRPMQAGPDARKTAWVTADSVDEAKRIAETEHTKRTRGMTTYEAIEASPAKEPQGAHA